MKALKKNAIIKVWLAASLNLDLKENERLACQPLRAHTLCALGLVN